MDPNKCADSVQEGENIKNGGEKEAVTIGAHKIGDDFVLKVGMLFNSDEEAYDVYNVYAIKRGFGVRKGSKKYNKHGQVTRREMYCSCNGISDVIGPNEERKRERLEYRCGCRARIIFKVINGLYEVTHFNDEHNHPMIENDKKHFISSRRKLGESGKNLIGPTVDADLRPKKASSFEGGGSQNVSFIKPDYHNFLQQRKRSLVDGGAATFILDQFRSMQAQDLSFFYAIQLDDEGRLMNIFWRDGLSRLHYEAFRDVVIFDITYHISKYDMICAPFMGIDNHWNNVLLGYALLSDESQTSLMWLFETFLVAMDGKAPMTIFTDLSPAIRAVLKDVLPSTRHCLRQWCIEKHVKKNSGHLTGNASFMDILDKLLWNVKSVDEFEFMWQKMMNEFDLSENSWSQQLYCLKEKWSPAFNFDLFSADSMLVQRGESIDNLLKQLSYKTTLFSEYFKSYEQMLRKMRELELQNDHKMRGQPKLLINCGILEHASRVYTRPMFSRFQKEFLQAMSEQVIEKSEVGSSHIFTLLGGHVVQFDAHDSTVSCNCHKFETMGYFCSHALRVLHVDLVLKLIPNQYVLKRWTKAAKKSFGFDNYCNDQYNTLMTPAEVRLNSLMRRCFAIMSIACQDENHSNEAHYMLNELEQKLNMIENEVGGNNGGAQMMSSYGDSHMSSTQASEGSSNHFVDSHSPQSSN